MRTLSFFITLTLLTLSTSLTHAALGIKADDKSKMAPLVEPVDSPELAKLIMKPSPKTMPISNDPFKPIMSKSFVDESMISLDPKDAPAQILAEAMGDMNIVGIARMDQEYRAFITTADNKKGVYKAQDKIGNYTIERIEPNQVVFKLGENEIVKKRGKL